MVSAEAKIKSSDFEVLKKLRETPTSKQYHVRHRETSKEYMLKKVPMSEMCEMEIFHVKQEMKILSLLSHPNIIKFERVFVDKKHCMNIVMEYADSGTLNDLIT